jgi:hypothetical protein
MVLAMFAMTGGCLRRQRLLAADAPAPSRLLPAGVSGLVDARARFREIYCAVRADHGDRLPEDRPGPGALVTLDPEPTPTGRAVTLGPPRAQLRIVVVPGFLNECFIRWASPFSDGRAHLETHGYRTDIVHVSAMSSTQHNAKVIRDAVMRMALYSGERVMLVGHSKGVVDTLQALNDFPDLASRVAALVSVAGAVGGSPLADDTRGWVNGLLRVFDVRSCLPGDHEGLRSLRRSIRRQFLDAASLPASVKYFSVVGIASPDETSIPLRWFSRRLARLDPHNDGQVLASDAMIPGGVLLGFVRADHWAIALPFSRTAPRLVRAVVNRNAFPREVLLEAIVRTVEEDLLATSP